MSLATVCHLVVTVIDRLIQPPHDLALSFRAVTASTEVEERQETEQCSSQSSPFVFTFVLCHCRKLK